MPSFVAYYKKPYVRFDDYELPDTLKVKDFTFDYCPVMFLESMSMDEVYSVMQGENWSPNGEARQAIKDFELAHTSMSVGDIIYNIREDKYFWVAPIGFKEVRLVGNDT